MKKAADLIRFILSTKSNHEADDIPRNRMLLVHIIRHKNKQLYEENKEKVQGLIQAMIDKCNLRMVAAKELQTQRLEEWKEVQAKLIELEQGKAEQEVK